MWAGVGERDLCGEKRSFGFVRRRCSPDRDDLFAVGCRGRLPATATYVASALTALSCARKAHGYLLMAVSIAEMTPC